MAEFKISSGYVDVHLRDSTQTDLDRLKERLARTTGVTVPVAVKDETARGLRDLDGRLKTWAESHGQTVAMKVDTKGVEAAALKLRKANLDVEEATAKVAAAQEAAAEVTKKLLRGELDEAAAKKAAADAARAVETAHLAQAAAAHEAASAADRLAGQERQVAAAQQRLARVAALASAVDMLGMHKAAGNRKEYNSLLKDTERRFGDLEKATGTAFHEMESLGAQSLGGLKTALSGVTGAAGNAATALGPGMVAAIAAGLATLPAVATLAGGALDLGVGGALAGIGLKATMGSRVAEHALAGLKDYAGETMTGIDKPFEQTWVAIADSAKTTLGGIAPDLKHDFDAIAPSVSGLVSQLGHKLPSELHGILSAIQTDFPPISAELGSTLPEALGRSADGLKQIMDEVARNPEEFGNMITATGRVVQAFGTMTVWAIKVGEAFTRLNQIDGQLGSGLEATGNKLGALGAPLRSLGGLVSRFDLSSQSAGNTLTGFAGNLATAAAQAGAAATATGRLTQANKELEQSIQKILNPALAYSNDAIALKEAQIGLTAALKQSHGQMGLQTEKSRAATQAFNDLIAKTAQMREDEKQLKGATTPASQAIKDQVARLWDLAGSNKEAQDKVIRLAASLGVPLPKSAQTAAKSIDGVHTALGNLHDKKVKVTADTSQAYNAAAALQRYINSIFAHAGGGITLPNADGAVYDGIRRLEAYANGEDHVAQIAPAGAMRLWAEPETGGEAYIPLAQSKRGRSTAILGAVADRFGLVLARKMSDGGMLDDDEDDEDDGYAEASGGLMAFARGGLTPSQRRAAAKRAAKAREVRHDAGAKLIAGITAAMLSSLSKVQAFSSSVNSKIQSTFSGKTETRLLNWAKGIEKSMAAAATKAQGVADQIKQAKDYAASTTSTMAGTATLSSLGTIGSAADITSGLQYRLSALQGFSTKLEALAKAGLNKTTLQQIIDAGPDQGSVLADMLLKSVGSIKTINSEQSAIAKAAATVGNNAADAMYDSGKNASKGFLAGLYGQQKDLEKLMEGLGEKLAKGIAKNFGVKGSEARPPIKKHASGGLAAAGELALVGEYGPELVRFGAGARVSTAADTAQILGAVHVTNYITVTGTFDFSKPADAKRAAEQIGDAVRGEIRKLERGRRR